MTAFVGSFYPEYKHKKSFWTVLEPVDHAVQYIADIVSVSVYVGQ